MDTALTLVRLGARPFMKDSDGITALCAAAGGDNTAESRLLEAEACNATKRVKI
jgi:ankyrin repeat protein